MLALFIKLTKYRVPLACNTLKMFNRSQLSSLDSNDPNTTVSNAYVGVGLVLQSLSQTSQSVLS